MYRTRAGCTKRLPSGHVECLRQHHFSSLVLSLPPASALSNRMQVSQLSVGLMPRGPPVSQDCQDLNGLAGLPPFGASQGLSGQTFYHPGSSAYPLLPPSYRHPQQLLHGHSDQQPLLQSDYTDMSYSDYSPIAPMPRHAPRSYPQIPSPPPAPQLPLCSGLYYPRGEYDRPPPKSTELFDPKAPNSSSSSSSSSASSFSPLYHTGGPGGFHSSLLPFSGMSGPFTVPPSPSPSYLGSRTGNFPPCTFPSYVPPQGSIAAHSHQHKYQQTLLAYDDNLMSGAMANLRLNTLPMPQQLWNDQPTTMYSTAPTASSYYHHPHFRGGTYGGLVSPRVGSGRTAVNGSQAPRGAMMGGGTFMGDGMASSGSEEREADAPSSLRSEGSERCAAGHAVLCDGMAQHPSVIPFWHILEVVEVEGEGQQDQDVHGRSSDEIVEALKKAGGNVKFLNSSIIAIFKTASLATKGKILPWSLHSCPPQLIPLSLPASEVINFPQFRLRPWVAPLASSAAPCVATTATVPLVAPTSSCS